MTRPPFKWPGGKTRLVPKISKYLQSGRRLEEPFCGSCALSLNTQYDSYLLNDINHDLMSFYNNLKEDGDVFIEKCRVYFSPEFNTQEAFNRLRTYFNLKIKDRPDILLYLNRHCFNGLVRYNSKGLFNSPFGKYTAPYFPEEELQELKKNVLEKSTMSSKDFKQVFSEDVAQGDVVYCDPPYIPLSVTSSFTSYSSGGFSDKDQRDLSACAKRARDYLNVPVIVSNSDTPLSREIYKDASRIETVTTTRHIAAKSSSRGKVQEILALYLPKDPS